MTLRPRCSFTFPAWSPSRTSSLCSPAMAISSSLTIVRAMAMATAVEQAAMPYVDSFARTILGVAAGSAVVERQSSLGVKPLRVELRMHQR